MPLAAFDKQLEEKLKHYFGFTSFRAGQKEIIEDILKGEHVFVLMPTGGGKSLCYQFPALLKSGMALVISPLIALMKDQVDALLENGIKATYLNSSVSLGELREREKQILKGEIKLLYVSPEKLLSEGFLEFLKRIDEEIRISFFVIDEAHCISEWGHDFRPEYRQMKQIRSIFPHINCVALTATATNRVRQDIIQQLHVEKPKIHIHSFHRQNLFYEVRPKNKNCFHQVLELLEDDKEASSIIYCQSRKSVETLSDKLNSYGIKALPYHAGLDASIREYNQEQFIKDNVQVMVATIAFGMGINKPDVRLVVHYDLPKNLEGYYQESGRAGRDGEKAKCILFFSYGDKAKIDHLIGQKTDTQEVQIAKRQLEQVINYAETAFCRTKNILNYFAEQIKNCGHCDNCLNPRPLTNQTLNAQKFLSCVARLGTSFGLSHIVNILLGERTDKVKKYKHFELSTFGIGKEKDSEFWKWLGRSLIQANALQISEDIYATLKLNLLSAQILKGQYEFLIPERRANIQTEIPRASGLDEFSEALFQRLRKLRKKLADAEGVPPYIIFSDQTLRLMSSQRPKTQRQFLNIAGVGEKKLKQYSEAFLGQIQAYCLEYDLD